MEIIAADIVIVGGGPCGSAVAWRLAQAGLDVACIERGDWFPYDVIGRDEPGWELRRARELHSNPNIRRGRDDAPVDDAESPIKPMIGNAVGGGSVYWSAHVPRFRPEDFKMATLDGVGDDWPISYDDLAPYYAENEKRLGTAFIPGDPSAPPHGDHCLTLPTIGAHGRRVAAALDRLGWHWWPVDLVVGRDADDAATVHCTHIGPCDLGCPSRIRSGADRAYMCDAVEGGVRLLTRTRVTHLEHDASDRVTAALCQTDKGQLRVEGRVFILAANGMGTPHLLLLSRSKRFPQGLANRSGLVGRNLMLHPYARVDGLFRGASRCVGARREGRHRLFRVLFDEARARFRARSQAATHGWPATGRFGLWRHHRFHPRLGAPSITTHLRIASIGSADSRSAPKISPKRRIGSSCRPRFPIATGLPAPKMVYRVSENSRRILDFGMDRAAEVLRSAGAEELYRTPLRAEAGFHLMGTARMGVDPDRSVVDPFGRCHDVPNLFIADASVFVTSTAVNPTATAQALALRTAEHIVATGSA